MSNYQILLDTLGYEPVILDGCWDNYFKSIISGEWCNQSDGNVEAPTGWFSYITITSNELAELRDAFDFEPLSMQKHEDGSVTFNGFGWVGAFITWQDSNGLIWVCAVRNDRDALKGYEALQAQYNQWGTDEDRDA